MSDAPVLLTEARDGVLLLTMHRPARRNAVDRALADALSAAFDDFEADPALRVAVLTGDDVCFSAGTDLAAGASPATEGGEYGFVRRQRTKPLVAAVEGYALGGGFEMVLACDLVVAARDATFGLPEVKRGVVANCGAFFRAPERLAPAVATEMLLTGDSITAERAHRLGLVNVLSEPGGAVDAARALAARIVENSPQAVATTLGALHEARAEGEVAQWRRTEEAAARTAASSDAVEGITAFFEKRAPRWS
ncbi:enoyl-CoA hydratase-related protein [Nocardioides alkalitolerans]|uniref:enoyl-CoA hydratase-related protein n=1 Tax=Nocardioides alkalitolerans TaxID=281714 RepID=UPI00040642D3|nr:enoyl-CoA hydratase-related protein [Nocardioides alkalitolerans]